MMRTTSTDTQWAFDMTNNDGSMYDSLLRYYSIKLGVEQCSYFQCSINLAVLGNVNVKYVFVKLGQILQGISLMWSNTLWRRHRIIYFLFKFDLDRRTMDTKYNLTGVRTHDPWIMRDYFMPLRCFRPHSHQWLLSHFNPSYKICLNQQIH